MHLMLLNLVHILKCETNLLFYPRNPTSTFRNGDVLEPFSEGLTLNVNIHPCASYCISVLQVMAVSIPSALAK